MTEKVARLLAAEGGEIRDDYSGRGMRGKEVFGVTFDGPEEFRAALLEVAYQAGEDGDYGVIQELRNAGGDQMGTGIIIY